MEMDMDSEYDMSSKGGQSLQKCNDCGATVIDSSSLSYFSKMMTSNTAKYCTNCHCYLCTKCAETNCLVFPTVGVSDQETEGYSFDKDMYEPLSYKATKKQRKELYSKENIQQYCFKCFKQKSTIDFSRTYDVYGPVGGAPVIFAHASPFSRMMCSSYAEDLSIKTGCRCYTFDFPGHGSRCNEACTMESCLKAINDIADLAINEDPSHRKPLYVGYSFGGYIGFQALADYGDKFSCAVISDCGINFGPGKGFGASIGLFFMKRWLPKITNQMMTEGILGGVPKMDNFDDDLLMRSIFQAGIYFQQVTGVMKIFETVNVAECVPKFKGPILFMCREEGGEAEKKWVELCYDRSESKLKYIKNSNMLSNQEEVDEYVADLKTFYEARLSKIGTSNSSLFPSITSQSTKA